MNAFEVTGSRKLKGEIHPQGAKNEALQVISAVLLTEEEVVIKNIPDILDVSRLITLLEALGVKIKQLNKHTYSFKSEDVNTDFLYSEDFRKKGGALRGSIMIAGPMLARFKKAVIAKPGGDKIGRRGMDTHVDGFEKLGAHFTYNTHTFCLEFTTKALKGNYIMLDEPSVTGTANVLMAAVLAKGNTTIYNAACEPYVQQLCKMLNRMGAKISGIASNMLEVEGVEGLHGTEHTLLPDMIEIGSFIGMAALTQSDITIKNVSLENLGVIPDKFKRLGIEMEFRNDDIYIPEQKCYEIQPPLNGNILTIYDHPWPGFTPDLLSIVLVTAIQARGSVLIHQKMFESRLFFTDTLIDMGAKIILCDPHRATVIGLEREHHLKGIRMSSPDIRAGVALLIAAMSAEGKSIIQNIEQIQRGYENIEQRLNALGAEIKLIND
ncbi:UDP-N-acetylglucosamine 1-carboxyvinyltransferase [Haoranjiania flava]|uniref:UDP-N-acetylglucosamine 1-carboxyvinyltransferase n=1 Tax=Haoranjiania flava TaxID=1856322 RepID=A0AAE3IKL0_9BACT|nr:UDP-N-acetylglucosamine 1-carboxyvinyltransferase [Haoranjiania flava]MCU7692948.1 UDP-N-acetylglucosamine 1-carboxyvinyltransferase [Haoranjiania flava]